MKTIRINSEYITLGQFLKFAGIVQTGGMVKPFLEEATIFVNGEQDNRRGRKIYPGMTVAIVGEGEFRVESL